MIDWTMIALLTNAAAAIGATVISGMSYRASKRNGQKIEAVHVSINSRMDQLLTEKGLASLAAGVEQGRNEGKSEPLPIKIELVNKPKGE